MDREEDHKPKKPEVVIGEDLDAISIIELERRIEILSAEIERLRSSIAEKKKGLQAANSVFKL